MLNYFKVLGVGPMATPAQLKAAYRRLALEHHPDTNSGSREEAEAAAARFRLVAEAYKTLANDELRQEYTLRLLEHLHETQRYLCFGCGAVNRITRPIAETQEPVCGVCGLVIPLTDSDRERLRQKPGRGRRGKTLDRIASEAKSLAGEIAWAALAVAERRYRRKF